MHTKGYHRRFSTRKLQYCSHVAKRYYLQIALHMWVAATWWSSNISWAVWWGPSHADHGCQRYQLTAHKCTSEGGVVQGHVLQTVLSRCFSPSSKMLSRRNSCRQRWQRPCRMPGCERVVPAICSAYMCISHTSSVLVWGQHTETWHIKTCSGDSSRHSSGMVYAQSEDEYDRLYETLKKSYHLQLCWIISARTEMPSMTNGLWELSGPAAVSWTQRTIAQRTSTGSWRPLLIGIVDIDA